MRCENVSERGIATYNSQERIPPYRALVVIARTRTDAHVAELPSGDGHFIAYVRIRND